MRRFLALGAALAFLAGAVPAHAMAPVLMALSGIYSIYEKVNEGIATADSAARDACNAWAETDGEVRALKRVRPMAAANPKIMAATAAIDTVMGQSAAGGTPAACQSIPTGGILENAVWIFDVFDTAPTQTAAAHIAMIRDATAKKRTLYGLPDLPAPVAAAAAKAPPAPFYLSIPHTYAGYR